jgi:Pre-mRNA splicing Prp18-interacting factor
MCIEGHHSHISCLLCCADAVKQTEAYVEYDRTGRIVKGAPKAIAKSKYEEVSCTVSTTVTTVI